MTVEIKYAVTEFLIFLVEVGSSRRSPEATG